MDFINTLKQANIKEIKKIPKSDLHNHFVLGGSRRYILQKTGIPINPLTQPLQSMKEMDSWSQKYIGACFNTPKMRKFLIEATMQQAVEDGISIIEIGEDVWGLKEFFHNDINELIDAFYQAREGIAFSIFGDVKNSIPLIYMGTNFHSQLKILYRFMKKQKRMDFA